MAPPSTDTSRAETPTNDPAVGESLEKSIEDDGGEKRSPGGVIDDGADEPLPPRPETAKPEFKEGGYGWVVVASVWMVNAHTWGLNSSYGVFLAYFLRSGTITGATPLALAFVGGLSVSMALLVSPIVTLSMRELGVNWTLRIGVLFETAAFIGASFSYEIWHLVLSQGVAFGIGMGFLFVGTVGLVPQWFTKRRSFANSIATSGSGFGGLIYSLGVNAMISSIGIGWSFRILGIIGFVVNGAATLLIRDRNQAVGAVYLAFHAPLFKRVEYWLFMSWGFFSMLGYVIVIFSLADYAQKVGFTASQGSIVAAMFNLSQGIGRPIIGLVSDRVGRLNVAGLGTGMAAVTAFFLWIFAGKYYAGLIIYSLTGAFAGIIWPTVAPVGAEVVGISLLPSALAIYWLVLVPPATVSEAIGLTLRKTGVDGYIDVQVFTAMMYVGAFVSIWLLRSWKHHEMSKLRLTDEQRLAEVQNADAVPADTALDAENMSTGSSLRAYWRGLWAIEKI